VAHDLLLALAVKAQVDVLLVSEPNRHIALQDMWRTDDECNCAIALLSNTAVLDSGVGLGHVWIELKNIRIFSCYFSPNISQAEVEECLESLSANIGSFRQRTIVGGDFNAKSPEWGGSFEDTRGSILADWAATMSLQCLNKGNTPTFERGDYGSVLDVTFSSESLARKLQSWKVLDTETLSDHRCLEICFREATKQESVPSPVGWILDETGKVRLEETLGRGFKEEVRFTPETLTEELTHACTRSLRKRGRQCKKPVYWWNAEIADKRRTCVQARRHLKRECRRGPVPDYLIQNLRLARRELAIEIKRSKQQCWRKLCESVNEDPWEKVIR
jgi:hypothetical protein